MPKSRRLSRPYAWLAAAVLSTIMCASVLTAEAEDPVLKLHSLSLESTRIAHGQPLYLLVQARRYRMCDTHIDRVITTADGTVVVQEHVTGNIAGPSMLGKDLQWRIRVKLPPDLPPGDYRYNSTLYSSCGADEQLQVITLEQALPFTVTASDG